MSGCLSNLLDQIAVMRLEDSNPRPTDYKTRKEQMCGYDVDTIISPCAN